MSLEIDEIQFASARCGNDHKLHNQAGYAYPADAYPRMLQLNILCDEL